MRGRFNAKLNAQFLGSNEWKVITDLTYSHESIDPKLFRDFDFYHYDPALNAKMIVAESGFISNLASVPRTLWSIVAPWDIARAAVIHDRMYREAKDKNMFTSKVRKAMDKLFLYAMLDASPRVPRWKVWICYAAVRSFGWIRKEQK